MAIGRSVFLFYAYLFAGIIVLLCIPGILIAEAGGGYEGFFHLGQFIFCVICFISGVICLARYWRQMSTVRKSVVWFGILGSGAWLAIIIFLMVSFAVVPVIEDYAHRRDFDSELWRSQEENDVSEWPMRLCMVDDLIGKGILDGRTREEVVELLGPPTWDYAGNAGFCYLLGPGRGVFGIDCETFVIVLENNMVAEYFISR